MPVFVPVEDVDIDAIKDVGGLSSRTKQIRVRMINTLEMFLKTLNKENVGDNDEVVNDEVVNDEVVNDAVVNDEVGEANPEHVEANSNSATNATDDISGSVLDSLVKQVF